MKNLTLLPILFILISCGSKAPMGDYSTQLLPDNFKYEIIENNSNLRLEKNEVTVLLSEKVTVDQLANIAQVVYSKLEPTKRFYIFYQLPGFFKGNGCWATSHFDPVLSIDIKGNSISEDSMVRRKIKSIKGDILGVWQYNTGLGITCILTKLDNSYFLKLLYSDGSEENTEVIKSNFDGKEMYSEKKNSKNYLIINSPEEASYFEKKKEIFKFLKFN